MGFKFPTEVAQICKGKMIKEELAPGLGSPYYFGLHGRDYRSYDVKMILGRRDIGRALKREFGMSLKEIEEIECMRRKV
jgi:hypothetical protein